MLVILSLSVAAAARQLQEGSGFLLLLYHFLFLEQDFTKSSAHAFSYILLSKLRSSSFFPEGGFPYSSAGCRWGVSYTFRWWLEWGETALPSHVLPTASTDTRSSTHRAAVAAQPGCPCPVSSWRWAGAQEVGMRERAACLGRRGLEEWSGAANQEGSQGRVSPSCPLSSGAGAFLSLDPDLVVLFMHKPELRLSSLVQVNGQELGMAQVPPAGLPGHTRIPWGGGKGGLYGLWCEWTRGKEGEITPNPVIFYRVTNEEVCSATAPSCSGRSWNFLLLAHFWGQ